MLCGQSVSGIEIAVSYILKEFQYVHNGFRFIQFFLCNVIIIGRIRIKLKFI